MKWKFWEGKTETGEQRPESHKLPKPKDIPEPVGRYLVVELGKNPDWVWNLKAVVRPRPDGKDRYDVRVFNLSTAAQAKVTVKDYTSLDGHPEAVLYEGWYDKKSFKVEIHEISPVPRAA
jgi:hypothetical protein